MDCWHAAVHGLGVDLGGHGSFDLDFHTIPYHGDDALIQKHYVSKRSRRQRDVLAFLVRDADARGFAYAKATVRKADQNDEILRFAKAWRARTGASRSSPLPASSGRSRSPTSATKGPRC